ncbi:MAG TPA: hypothetical protein VIN60_02805 [Anaerolineales bacterium]
MSSVCRITPVTEEISPLLSCVHHEHDQHRDADYNQKDIHTLRIAQIVPTVL